MVTLDKIKVGQKAAISVFNNSSAKCFSSRFGIEEGQIITCIAKPGSIVIQKALQEIAIGKKLSQEILVNLL
ncbi:MAG: FeoA domain-containing protein [bacterium]